MVAACDAGTITLYDTYQGKKKNTLNCRQHGACHVTYTHAANCVLHASATSKVRTAIHLRCYHYYLRTGNQRCRHT